MLMVLRSCPALSWCVISSFGCLPHADGATVLSRSQNVRDLVFWPAYLMLIPRQSPALSVRKRVISVLTVLRRQPILMGCALSSVKMFSVF
ncbi:hypothetical protein EV702DRAFT_1134810 [Suillus placidus]|uniref:Secreted protein n=1 Tax=Suillus placidus TaxID=48579 RepID=A0A9P7CYR8_9AGAM|nr:hypothetical protein EV702DRAFT_1134810 [Suillus placidus]